MKAMHDFLRTMDFDFLSASRHKILPEALLADKNNILLDIRTREEAETVELKFLHHLTVLHIPMNELPDRLDEIPKDKTIGIFCSRGVRAAMIFFYLQSLGYTKARTMPGGYETLIPELMTGKIKSVLDR